MIVILDVLFWAVFALYLSGGVPAGGQWIGGYIGDVLRGAAGLGAIAALFGVDLTRLGFVRAFEEASLALEERRPPRLIGAWVVLVAGVYLAVLFFLVPLLRHWSFSSWFWDLGAAEQALWRGTHGERFSFTAMRGPDGAPLDLIGENHLYLWFYPLSVLYRLLPFTETLLVLQSLALFSAGIVLWKIARKLFPSNVRPVLIVVYFWLFQNLHRVNTWDMHENAFIGVVALLAFYFFIQEKLWLAGVFALGVACFKEDAWVISGAIFGYFLIKKKKPVWAIVAMTAGLAVFLVYSTTRVQAIPLAARYAYLGDDVQNIGHVVLQKPWIFLVQLFSLMNLKYVGALFLAAGGLWTLGGWALLPVAPTAFEIMLSTHERMRSFDNHYTIPLMGPLFFAAIVGMVNLNRWLRTSRGELKLHNSRQEGSKQASAFKFGVKSDALKKMLTLSTLIACFQLTYSEPQAFREYLMSDGWRMRKCYTNLVAKIPQDVPLYAEDPLFSHLSRRRDIWLFDSKIPLTKAGWVVMPKASAFVLKEGLHLEPVIEDCGFQVARVE